MAALQLSDRWLSTSCGSPHYAAPEIVLGRRYSGSKADIWSCGIILFALLAGFLPFDGGDICSTLRLVKKGEYCFPNWFSEDASDLIRCILQKQPEERIAMHDIWNHPLLKKYENSKTKASAYFISPGLSLSAQECGPVLGLGDIDNDIFQSLQKISHGVDTGELVRKLLDVR